MKSIFTLLICLFAITVAYPQCTATVTLQGSGPTCTNGTTTYTYVTESGKASYTWQLYGTTGASIVSGQNTNTVTVKFTSATGGQLNVAYPQTGCTNNAATGSSALSILAMPSATITGPSVTCYGTQFTLTTVAGMTNYTWLSVNPNTGASTALPSQVIVSGQGTNSITLLYPVSMFQTTTPITFGVQYLDASQNGCMSYGTKQLTMSIATTPVINGNFDPCLVATPYPYSAPAGSTGYQWSIVGGTINSGQGTNSISVVWTTSGAQSLSVQYGCMTAPITQAINVHQLSTLTPTGPTTVSCSNTSATYSVPSTPGTTYNWYFNPAGSGTITSGQGTNSVTATWPNGGATAILLQYTQYGCAQYSSLGVTVNGPSMSGSTSVCIGTTGSVYAVPTGAASYSWTVTGGTITSGQGTESIQVTWNTTGTQTVTLNYTGTLASCGANTLTKNVTVRALPATPTLSGPSSVCQNVLSPTPFQAPNVNGATYDWTFTGSTSVGFFYSVNPVFQSTGSQTITLNYTDPFGCKAPAPAVKTVTVLSNPIPVITGSTTACTQTLTPYSTAAGKAGYSWTITGGSLISGFNTNAIQVQWTTAGAGKVEVVTTETNGCSSPKTTLNVTVSAMPAAPTLTIPNMTYVNGVGQWCFNYPFLIDVTPNNAYSYQLTLNGNPSSPQSTSRLYTSSFGPTPATLTYLVDVVYTNGCANSAQKQVYHIVPPTGTISGPDHTFINCNSTFNLTTSTTQNVSNYRWQAATTTTPITNLSSTTTTLTYAPTTVDPLTIYVGWDYLYCKCQFDPYIPWDQAQLAYKTVQVWDYTISPNPANNTLTITLPQTAHPDMTYEIRDLLSNLVSSGQLLNGNAAATVNTTSLTNGQYYVTCYFEAGAGKPLLTKALQISH